MELSLSISIHANAAGEKADFANRCEDERLFCVSQDGRFLLGVFDGCGGSGAKQYARSENWTGARIASHEAARAVGEWFVSSSGSSIGDDGAEEIANSIKECLAKRLKEKIRAMESLNEKPAILTSGLIQELPTTMAVIIAEPCSDNRLKIRSFWAGNSRNYVFSSKGLFQISRDDLIGDYDPFDDLTKDGILSNAVNASEAFAVHSYETVVDEPVILFSATDGTFSYFDSPIRLEWYLADKLMRADSPEIWEAILKKELDAYSSDDHAMQLAAVGFCDFDTMKKAYRQRWQELKTKYVDVLDAAFSNRDSDVPRQLWNVYKKDYLKL